jgi:hypothetical protein
VFVVLFEDTAALIGIGIAAVGIAASEVLHRPVLDGAASIGIGLLLGAVSIFLARESKGLLIGEPADSSVVASICAIAREHPGVERADGLFTVHLAPEQIVAGDHGGLHRHLVGRRRGDRPSAPSKTAYEPSIPDIILLLVKPQGSVVLARVRSGARKASRSE